jgi:hypothetical protein
MMSQPFRKIGVSLLGLALLPASLEASEAEALAARIDHHLAAHWAGKDVQPAPRTDDAAFIRRVYLDLAGRIPSIIEVRDFLDDTRPDKRAIWVQRLLESPTYAQHFAHVWRALWLSAANNEQTQVLAAGFEGWLRQRLKENTGYDQMVRELLTAAPSVQGTSTPGAFYQVNELKPENLAANTSRLFLGVKLECAQCHAHPFAPWTRTQFWEYAAFFTDVVPRQGPAGDGRTIKIPGTDKVVPARFLDGTAPRWQTDVAPRATLADWLTAADNRYFARAAVNQLWAYFFGTGLIDPVDEAGDQNPPSHPELLDELARAFAAHRFDLPFLIRALVATEAYQRSSVTTHASQDDSRLFARMAVRALSPEQLFDSLAEVTEYREPPGADRPPFNGSPSSPRQQFLARFAQADRRTEAQTTILQALFLMNGSFMADATSLEGNRTLATIAQASATGTARRIETLYLVALSRKPRPEEAARLLDYVNRGGPSGDPKKALADIFWALVNSAEFILNH